MRGRGGRAQQPSQISSVLSGPSVSAYANLRNADYRKEFNTGPISREVSLWLHLAIPHVLAQVSVLLGTGIRVDSHLRGAHHHVGRDTVTEGSPLWLSNLRAPELHLGSVLLKGRCLGPLPRDPGRVALEWGLKSVI